MTHFLRSAVPSWRLRLPPADTFSFSRRSPFFSKLLVACTRCRSCCLAKIRCAQQCVNFAPGSWQPAQATDAEVPCQQCMCLHTAWQLPQAADLRQAQRQAASLTKGLG